MPWKGEKSRACRPPPSHRSTAPPPRAPEEHDSRKYHSQLYAPTSATLLDDGAPIPSPVAVRRDNGVHDEGLGDGTKKLPGRPLRDVVGVSRGVGVGVLELAPLEQHVHELFAEAPVNLQRTSSKVSYDGHGAGECDCLSAVPLAMDVNNHREKQERGACGAKQRARGSQRRSGAVYTLCALRESFERTKGGREDTASC